MKKHYHTPTLTVNAFDYCDGIAVPFDPNASTEENLGKRRDSDDTDDRNSYSDPEWQNGLW